METDNFKDLSEYYKWLISRIEPPKDILTPICDYKLLLYELWKREFSWLDNYEGEESRAYDGKTLRDTFVMEHYASPDMVPHGPCRVLEMLIAFAERIDISVHDWRMGKRPWEWMEMFIENLGFASLTDMDINPERDSGYINAKLETWMSHHIESKGEGGLFRFVSPVSTIKTMDNWEQMNQWIKENF